MSKNHEKLLVAILAGMIMVFAAAFAVQPALAKLPPQHELTVSVLPR